MDAGNSPRSMDAGKRWQQPLAFDDVGGCCFETVDMYHLIIDSGISSMVAVARVDIDLDTDDPELLAAVCETVKGQHDYGRTD